MQMHAGKEICLLPLDSTRVLFLNSFSKHKQFPDSLSIFQLSFPNSLVG